MERLFFEDMFIDFVEVNRDKIDMQDCISWFIHLKKDLKNKGWRNITIEPAGGVKGLYFKLRGDRQENDQELVSRKTEVEKYKKMDTKDLLVELEVARRHKYVSWALRHVLDGREHVPSRAEKKVLRQLKARTGIKDDQELREKHGKDIAEMLKVVQK